MISHVAGLGIPKRGGGDERTHEQGGTNERTNRGGAEQTHEKKYKGFFRKLGHSDGHTHTHTHTGSYRGGAYLKIFS